ncbi:MAG: hypothetical protein WCK00_11590 [Deltaproteobacteria bacterium]
MTEKSRVKFNPGTKEIEIEGSESFVTATFDKLQAMISGVPVKKVPIQKEPKATRIHPQKNVSKMTTGPKRGALSEAVLTLISASPEGISATELKEKTGLKEMQIRNVLSSFFRQGKIGTVRRGVYIVAAAPVANPEEKMEEKMEKKTEQPQLSTPNDQFTALNSSTE